MSEPNPAKVLTVTVSRSVKVNLGNYESTDLLFVSMTAEVDREVYRQLLANVRACVKQQLLQMGQNPMRYLPELKS